MIVYYSVEDHDSIYEHEVSDGIWIHRPSEQRQIIEQCADDYFSNHDGWEDRWPLEFRLYDPVSKEVIATLNVDIDNEPVFRATHTNGDMTDE